MSDLDRKRFEREIERLGAAAVAAKDNAALARQAELNIKHRWRRGALHAAFGITMLGWLLSVTWNHQAGYGVLIVGLVAMMGSEVVADNARRLAGKSMAGEQRMTARQWWATCDRWHRTILYLAAALLIAGCVFLLTGHDRIGIWLLGTGGITAGSSRILARIARDRFQRNR